MKPSPWLCCATPLEAQTRADVHVFGVGKTACVASLVAEFSRRVPERVLLLGVAGLYPGSPTLAVGDVCVVGSDGLADEGVETPDGFVGISALGLGEGGPWEADGGWTTALAAALGLQVVAGITVSTCAGNDGLAHSRRLRTGARVESMEGAAVAYVCRQFKVPFAQIRAISNRVGDRERGGWDLELAVERLHRAVTRLEQQGWP